MITAKHRSCSGYGRAAAPLKQAVDLRGLAAQRLSKQYLDATHIGIRLLERSAHAVPDRFSWCCSPLRAQQMALKPAVEQMTQGSGDPACKPAVQGTPGHCAAARVTNSTPASAAARMAASARPMVQIRGEQLQQTHARSGQQMHARSGGPFERVGCVKPEQADSDPAGPPAGHTHRHRAPRPAAAARPSRRHQCLWSFQCTRWCSSQQ